MPKSARTRFILVNLLFAWRVRQRALCPTHALAPVPLRQPSLAHLVHKPNFPHLPIPNAFPTFPSPCNSIPHLAPPAHNSEDYAPLLTTPHIHMRSLYILSLAPLVYRTCARSPSVHTANCIHNIHACTCPPSNTTLLASCPLAPCRGTPIPSPSRLHNKCATSKRLSQRTNPQSSSESSS